MSDDVRNEVMDFQPISQLAETVDMSETWVRKLANRDGKSGGWAFERRKVKKNERKKWPAPLQYVYRATDMPVAFGRGDQPEEALSSALQKAEKRIIGLESQLATKSNRVDTLTDERDSAQERAKQLQSQVTELTNKANQAQEVADALESKVEEIEQNYIDLERMFLELSERHQSLLEKQPSDLLMQMTEEIEWFALEADFDMTDAQKSAFIELLRLAIRSRNSFKQSRRLTAEPNDQTNPEASQHVTSAQQGLSLNSLANFVEGQVVTE